MQVESVIDIMWGVSYDFFTLLYGNLDQYGVNKIKDWRELLELKKRHPDLARKINSIHNRHSLTTFDNTRKKGNKNNI